jgi:4-methylaminobutanoate oxidase (formaldehyde-forming)
MAKFSVQGKDAGTFLNRLSTNNVNGDCGIITYTQFLDEDGKMQADVTVLKLEETKFIVIATDTMLRHVETWMKKHVGDRNVFINDVTGSYGQINLQGINSIDYGF